jgi:hypothetical protein
VRLEQPAAPSPVLESAEALLAVAARSVFRAIPAFLDLLGHRVAVVALYGEGQSASSPTRDLHRLSKPAFQW